MAMANPIVNETEEENSFWMDVYYYMEDTNCDKASAVKAIEAMYKIIGKG